MFCKSCKSKAVLYYIAKKDRITIDVRMQGCNLSKHIYTFFFLLLIFFRRGTILKHSLFCGGWIPAFPLQVHSWRFLVGGGHNDHRWIRRYDVWLYVSNMVLFYIKSLITFPCSSTSSKKNIIQTRSKPIEPSTFPTFQSIINVIWSKCADKA